MLVNVYGTVLNVHTGVSKSSGKSFRMADVYDGEDLLKVFSVPDEIVQGEVVNIRCRLSVDNNKLFLSFKELV